MTNFNTLVMGCLERGRLLAGQAQYVHMGRRFRRRGEGIDWTDLLLPIAVIACVLGAAWLVSRYFQLRAKRNGDSPQVLFAELCQAHGLDWSNQKMLRALADAHRLASPVQLFVEPERFDIERLGGAMESRGKQLAALRSRLFADSPSEGSESG